MALLLTGLVVEPVVVEEDDGDEVVEVAEDDDGDDVVDEELGPAVGPVVGPALETDTAMLCLTWLMAV